MKFMSLPRALSRGAAALVAPSATPVLAGEAKIDPAPLKTPVNISSC